MLIRFSFVNQYNPLEEDLLYIFNPLELRDFTTGLLCGISSADLMPCAFKCVITLKPQELTEAFRHQLLFTKKDLKRWEQLNMLLIDKYGKVVFCKKRYTLYFISCTVFVFFCIRVCLQTHTGLPVSDISFYIFHIGCTLHCWDFPSDRPPSGIYFCIFRSEHIFLYLLCNEKRKLY